MACRGAPAALAIPAVLGENDASPRENLGAPREIPAVPRKRWHGNDDGEVDDLPAARAEAAHDARDGLRFAQAKLDARAGTGTSVRWLLLRLQGESFAAIAQAEGTSEEAVTKSVRRVRAQLRAAWVAVAAIAVFWILRALFGATPGGARAPRHRVVRGSPAGACAVVVGR